MPFCKWIFASFIFIVRMNWVIEHPVNDLSLVCNRLRLTFIWVIISVTPNSSSLILAIIRSTNSFINTSSRGLFVICVMFSFSIRLKYSMFCFLLVRIFWTNSSRFCALKGLVIYASAPFKYPWVWSNSSVLAVSRITGIWLLFKSCLTYAVNSRPSITGIITSLTIRSGSCFFSNLQASAPL